MLEIRDLWLSLEGFTLSIERLTVERGERVVILGPSGVGKSLLIKTVVGALRPKRGKVIIDGKDVTNLPPEKREIGYVPQNYAIFKHMTVFDNIAYGLKVRNVKDLSKVYEVAERLGIKHLLNRKAKSLSGGEAQRVALARAIIIEPKVLLLDEPLSNLDPETKLRAIELIKEVSSTSLIVTHDIFEALELGDKIAYMRGGKLLGTFEKEEFLRSPYARPYLEPLKKLT